MRINKIHNTKKFKSTVVLIILILLLLAVFALLRYKGRNRNVSIDYGESEKFSHEE